MKKLKLCAIIYDSMYNLYISLAEMGAMHPDINLQFRHQQASIFARLIEKYAGSEHLMMPVCGIGFISEKKKYSRILLSLNYS